MGVKSNNLMIRYLFYTLATTNSQVLFIYVFAVKGTVVYVNSLRSQEFLDKNELCKDNRKLTWFIALFYLFYDPGPLAKSCWVGCKYCIILTGSKLALISSFHCLTLRQSHDG